MKSTQELLLLRKRFQNRYEWKGKVVYGSPPSESEEKDLDKEEIEGSSVVQPSPTSGDKIMTTSEALEMLTRNGKEDDEENAWLIIKAPKKLKGKGFLVDYCDGDKKDKYHWLEGPHKPEHTTVEDLLERRQSQFRRSRRQQGHTSQRDDQLDVEDPHGKREATPESPPQAVRFERVFWRCPPREQEPSKVGSGECKSDAGEGGDELTIVDIHILVLFQQIERFQKYLMDPTEDKEEVIKAHDEYLRLSEAGMASQEKLQIKSFKDIIDYDRCITVLNYDNWNTLTDKEKQEYASKTESSMDIKHQN